MIRPAFAVNIGEEFPLADKFPNLGSLISLLLKNAFIIAGLIFFFILIFSGVKFIVSRGNKEQIQKATGAIAAALIGLIIIFVSYWIIQLIETLTGIPILNQ